MKNAKTYEKKVKKLLTGLTKRKVEPIETADDPIRTLVRGVLEADAVGADAQGALEALEAEFVDYNELRVAPAKDVVECIGRKYPHAWDKAYMITTSLYRIYGRSSQVELGYGNDMGKRDLRRHLTEIGLSPYASAYALMVSFGGHALPVDQTLVDALEMEEYIHPGSDLADVQGFLERVINQKNDLAAHDFFREYLAERIEAIEEYRSQRPQPEEPAKPAADRKPSDQPGEEQTAQDDQPDDSRDLGEQDTPRGKSTDRKSKSARSSEGKRSKSGGSKGAGGKSGGGSGGDGDADSTGSPGKGAAGEKGAAGDKKSSGKSSRKGKSSSGSSGGKKSAARGKSGSKSRKS